MTHATETFAKRVKSELALNQPQSRRGQRALLSGFVRLAASLSIGSNPILNLRTEVSNAAKLAFNLFRSLYSLTPVFVFERRMRFDKPMVYVVRVSGECIYDVMEDLRALKNLRPIPLRSLVNEDNIQRFVQGLFIAAGSVNSPESKSYFLEISFPSAEDAQAVVKGLSKVNPRFCFRITPIRDRWMIYLKRSSEISEFLAWMGAPQAALEYENARAKKDFFNSENRLNICLAHNLSKTLKTAEENIRYIEIVKAHNLERRLDAKTQAVMRARVVDREANYAELAQRLTETGLPMTKSGVARALATIKELALKVSGEDQKDSAEKK